MSQITRLVGTKWALPILEEVGQFKKLNFNAIRANFKLRISPNHLSKMLKALVSAGLMERRREEERVFYLITGKGRQILKVVEEMERLV